MLTHFPDGLRYRHWQPEGTPSAAVLLVHGLGEHSGRYEALAAHFTQRGFAVVAPDHIGHGLSPGRRVFVRDFDEFLPGVRQCRALLRETYPELPCFLLGHSMGGLIAARLLLEDAEHYRGALFSGPAFAASEPPSAALRAIARLLAWMAPGLGLLALDPGGLSRDPAVVAAYEADPLVHHGKITAGLAVAIFDAMDRVMEEAQRLSLPVLIMHGEADSVVTPAGAESFAAAISSSDKTLTLLPGQYHEIFNEPEGAETIARFADWIDAHR